MVRLTGDMLQTYSIPKAYNIITGAISDVRDLKPSFALLSFSYFSSFLFCFVFCLFFFGEGGWGCFSTVIISALHTVRSFTVKIFGLVCFIIIGVINRYRLSKISLSFWSCLTIYLISETLRSIEGNILPP